MKISAYSLYNTHMIDFVVLELKAGDGGHGKVSFRREWRVPKGGPDGGDGGDGGSIIIKVNQDLSTLDALAGKKLIQASSGEAGNKRKRSGRKGEDLVVEVPPGTVIWQITENQAAHQRRLRVGIQQIAKRGEIRTSQYELEKEGQSIPALPDDEVLDSQKIDLVLKNTQFDPEQLGLIKLASLSTTADKITICQGGVGGRGNTHFKSSTRTTPFNAEYGSQGERRVVVFELKLLADIGLVGYPNAGKSTLLSRLTKARPKIAAYPFTTLEPHLGIYQHPNSGKELVLADIPGLIKGAHQGKGLGFQFLRHIENCQGLLFVLALDEVQLANQLIQPAAVAKELWQQYEQLKGELKAYKRHLEDKQQIVFLNKADLYTAEMMTAAQQEFAAHQVQLIVASAATGTGLADLHQRLLAATTPKS